MLHLKPKEGERTLHGLLITNAFMQSARLAETYTLLLEAAQRADCRMDIRTSTDLFCKTDESYAQYDFGLFWSKDVYLGRQLEQQGLRLFNSSEAVAVCDDKAKTYLGLRNQGIRMPRTILAPQTFYPFGFTDVSFLQQVIDTLGFPMILKGCYGSYGAQVFLIHNEDELREMTLQYQFDPLLYQEYISESHGRDTRINIVGGKYHSAILRESMDGDFRSNLARGGQSRAYNPTAEEIDLAEKAGKRLGLDFCGCDILFGKDGPVLCEVNSNAQFRGTLEATGLNMADAIFQHIKTTIQKEGFQCR